VVCGRSSAERILGLRKAVKGQITTIWSSKMFRGGGNGEPFRHTKLGDGAFKVEKGGGGKGK